MADSRELGKTVETAGVAPHFAVVMKNDPAILESSDIAPKTLRIIEGLSWPEPVRALTIIFPKPSRDVFALKLMQDLGAYFHQPREDVPTLFEANLPLGGRQTRLILRFGFDGNAEIVRAIKRASANGELIDEESIDEEAISKNLDIPDLPDVDAIFFVGVDASEKAINFNNHSTWQGAYAEFILLPEDPTDEDLQNAKAEFKKRKRRFGGTL